MNYEWRLVFGEQLPEKSRTLACLTLMPRLSLVAFHALASGFVLMLEMHLVVPLLLSMQLLLVLAALLGLLFFELLFRNTRAVPPTAFSVLGPC